MAISNGNQESGKKRKAALQKSKYVGGRYFSQPGSHKALHTRVFKAIANISTNFSLSLSAELLAIALQIPQRYTLHKLGVADVTYL